MAELRMKQQKEFPCIESTIDFDYDRITVRLWIDRDRLGKLDTHGDDLFIVQDVVNWLDEHKPQVEWETLLLRYLADIPYVNAAQVLFRLGDSAGAVNVKIGRVVYTVPFEDVHG